MILNPDIFGHSDAKKTGSHKSILYDHRPFQLNPDDYERVCHVPKLKVVTIFFWCIGTLL